MSRPFLLAMGTRPEYVKMVPVIQELRRLDVATHVVSTGQHHDRAMCHEFLSDIVPDETWQLSSDGSGRLGEMTDLAGLAIDRVRPQATVVLGDTHTVPIFALASRRAGVAVVHVEAGLRSLNPQSVEEVNRRVASALASLHFAPTDLAASFLTGEGVPDERIRVVGNTAIDVLRAMGLKTVPSASRTGVLVTAHRPTNVDGDRLHDLVRTITAVHRDIGHVAFPVHPRTYARLEQTGLIADLIDAGVELLAPVDHRRLLELLRHSRIVVTDSGGLQEEAAYLGVPAVVLRRSTPRWEGVQAGVAALASISPEEVVTAARRLLAEGIWNPTIYGDGKTASRIAKVLADPRTRSLLSLDEPDFTDGSVPVMTPVPET